MTQMLKMNNVDASVYGTKKDWKCVEYLKKYDDFYSGRNETNGWTNLKNVKEKIATVGLSWETLTRYGSE